MAITWTNKSKKAITGVLLAGSLLWTGKFYLDRIESGTKDKSIRGEDAAIIAMAVRERMLYAYCTYTNSPKTMLQTVFGTTNEIKIGYAPLWENVYGHDGHADYFGTGMTGMRELAFSVKGSIAWMDAEYPVPANGDELISVEYGTSAWRVWEETVYTNEWTGVLTATIYTNSMSVMKGTETVRMVGSVMSPAVSNQYNTVPGWEYFLPLSELLYGSSKTNVTGVGDWWRDNNLGDMLPKFQCEQLPNIKATKHYGISGGSNHVALAMWTNGTDTFKGTLPSNNVHSLNTVHVWMIDSGRGAATATLMHQGTNQTINIMSRTDQRMHTADGSYDLVRLQPATVPLQGTNTWCFRTTSIWSTAPMTVRDVVVNSSGGTSPDPVPRGFTLSGTATNVYGGLASGTYARYTRLDYGWTSNEFVDVALFHVGFGPPEDPYRNEGILICQGYPTVSTGIVHVANIFQSTSSDAPMDVSVTLTGPTAIYPPVTGKVVKTNDLVDAKNLLHGLARTMCAFTPKELSGEGTIVETTRSGSGTIWRSLDPELLDVWYSIAWGKAFSPGEESHEDPEDPLAESWLKTGTINTGSNPANAWDGTLFTVSCNASSDGYLIYSSGSTLNSAGSSVSIRTFVPEDIELPYPCSTAISSGLVHRVRTYAVLLPTNEEYGSLYDTRWLYIMEEAEANIPYALGNRISGVLAGLGRDLGPKDSFSQSSGSSQYRWFSRPDDLDSIRVLLIDDKTGQDIRESVGTNGLLKIANMNLANILSQPQLSTHSYKSYVRNWEGVKTEENYSAAGSYTASAKLACFIVIVDWDWDWFPFEWK